MSDSFYEVLDTCWLGKGKRRHKNGVDIGYFSLLLFQPSVLVWIRLRDKIVDFL